MAHDTVRKRVDLNADSVKWFEERYPESSLPAVLSLLFEKYREVATLTPSDYAAHAAKALQEDFDA